MPNCPTCGWPTNCGIPETVECDGQAICPTCKRMRNVYFADEGTSGFVPPDPFHDTTTQEDTLDALTSHADADRQSNAYKEQMRELTADPTPSELEDALGWLEAYASIGGTSQVAVMASDYGDTLRRILTEQADRIAHDPWSKADGHNWLFCDHPMCAMVRSYEQQVAQLTAERDWLARELLDVQPEIRRTPLTLAEIIAEAQAAARGDA
jgi:uncharacterized Zn finger protein (UPF0148 family)